MVLTSCLCPQPAQTRQAYQGPSGNKKPAHRRTSAAGKCLTRMDLPSAASEPSPPDSSRVCLNLERLHRHTQPMNETRSGMLSATLRARLEFVARGHRENPGIFVTIFWSQTH